MKDGWYWVKYKGTNGSWIPGRLTNDGDITEVYGRARFSHNYDIGDYIETPEKYR